MSAMASWVALSPLRPILAVADLRPRSSIFGRPSSAAPAIRANVADALSIALTTYWIVAMSRSCLPGPLLGLELLLPLLGLHLAEREPLAQLGAAHHGEELFGRLAEAGGESAAGTA